MGVARYLTGTVTAWLSLVGGSALAATITVPTATLPTIQAAVDAAAVAGDTIVVAPGTYTEQVRIVDKSLTLRSSSGAASTIIRGATPAILIAPSALPSPAMTVRLEGFTVTALPGTPSGGVRVAGASGLITQNRIVGNTGCNSSGLQIFRSDIAIRHNVIAGNTPSGCSGSGGGIDLLVSASEIRSNLIVGNEQGGGGAVAMNGYSGMFAENVVAGNAAFNNGAVWIGNVPDTGGLTMENNLVTGNFGANGGAVVWSGSAGAGGSRFVHNTVVDNVSTLTGDTSDQVQIVGFPGAVLSFANNVIAGSGGPVVTCAGTLTGPLTGNNFFRDGEGAVEAGCGALAGANGNVSVAPGFVDQVAGDFHLAPSSPLIDAGSTGTGVTVDSDGDPRPVDGPDANVGADPDIGFDEAADSANSLETTIQSGESGVTDMGQFAGFAFSSPNPQATFECSLDMDIWEACTSPTNLSGLERHIHVFRVRARIPTGAVDATPATRMWNNGRCSVIGTGGPDVLIGTDGRDRICGRAGSNLIAAGDGDDQVDGEGGNDLIDAGAGSDVIDGGPGLDVLDYSARTTPVFVSLAETGFGNGGVEDGGIRDSIAGVEDIIGGAASDVLIGGDGDNVLRGGPGSDALSGGGGIDRVDYSTATQDVTVDLSGSPSNDGEPGEGDTVGPDVEQVVTGTGNDVVSGNAVENFIDVGAGDDMVDTRDGRADLVFCDDGTDSVQIDQFDLAVQCEIQTVTHAAPPPGPPRPPAPARRPPPAPPSAAVPSPFVRPTFGVLTLVGVAGRPNGRITARLNCVGVNTSCNGRLTGTVTLVTKGRRSTITVTRKTLTTFGGMSVKGIRLNPIGMRLLGRKRRLVVRVMVETFREGRFVRTSAAKVVITKRARPKTTTSPAPTRVGQELRRGPAGRLGND